METMQQPTRTQQTASPSDPTHGQSSSPLRVFRGVLLMCLLLGWFMPTLVLAAATPKEEHLPAKGRRRPGNVLILGSSSINGSLGKTFAHGLQRSGFSVYKLGVGSSGLSRPDYFDWRKRVATLPITKRTALALVYLGGNDAQAIRTRPSEISRWRRRWTAFGHATWSKRYVARVAELARALCLRGVQQVVFIPPPDVGKRRLQRRLAKVRRGQIRGAARVRCARVIRSRGALRRILAERRQPRRSRARRPARLRQPDGVHFTRAGASRLWNQVRRGVIRRAKVGVAKWQRDERRARLRAQRIARRKRLRRQRIARKRLRRQRRAKRRVNRKRPRRKQRRKPKGKVRRGRKGRPAPKQG